MGKLMWESWEGEGWDIEMVDLVFILFCFVLVFRGRFGVVGVYIFIYSLICEFMIRHV